VAGAESSTPQTHCVWGIRYTSAPATPAFLADVVNSVPLPGAGEGSLINTTIDIAGPDPIRMDDLVRQYLSASGDPRQVTIDPSATYFGIPVNDQSLAPPAARAPARHASENG
jgi:uncharacterized protein YbjT (DUF2867 family)